ncbi:(2Fe-2S)-binding protein [Fodinicurvata sediminis]|uniref:(2Fe-2S)-binding protein n=1 Tax=Fodinicurvata sediminis TaxID=1121832 RepID=UPI0003B6FA6E|nr:(2Fe-2S)-binding protein [Fodinicurvata sediminis]
MTVTFTLNGRETRAQADAMTPLARVLREELFLTGTKIACGEGFCGACTVLLDGAPAAACLLPLGLAEGREVRTVEGLAPASGGGGGDEAPLAPLQQAFLDQDVVQCGMCFPGILMALTPLFERNQTPTEDELRAALTGNICRCTGYEQIISAALSLRQPNTGEGAAS